VRRPPRVADALLRYLAPGHEALAGDLIEQFREGRSAAWFWRQTLATYLGGGILAAVVLHMITD
jgi:hypothetical protein